MAHSKYEAGTHNLLGIVAWSRDGVILELGGRTIARELLRQTFVARARLARERIHHSTPDAPRKRECIVSFFKPRNRVAPLQAEIAGRRHCDFAASDRSAQKYIPPFSHFYIRTPN